VTNEQPRSCLQLGHVYEDTIVVNPINVFVKETCVFCGAALYRPIQWIRFRLDSYPW